MSLSNMKELQHELSECNADVVLKYLLKGGVVSQVYAAEKQGSPVVVKHVDDFSPTYPTNLFISKEMLNVEIAVLSLLGKTSIRAPRFLGAVPAISTIVMEDLMADGYTLLSTSILRKKLPIKSASNIGAALAQLASASRSWERFATVESASSSMVQRGLELRLAYPNDDAAYNVLEREHTSHDSYWTWADGYPKNILINENGDPAFIDFAESYWGDQRIILPIFVAHIAIYALAGFIDGETAQRYIIQCVETYRDVEGLEERIFRQYFAMELIHRSTGRWIEGIETAAQKVKLFRHGLYAFEEEVSIIELIRNIT